MTPGEIVWLSNRAPEPWLAGPGAKRRALVVSVEPLQVRLERASAIRQGHGRFAPMALPARADWLRT